MRPTALWTLALVAVAVGPAAAQTRPVVIAILPFVAQ